MSSTSASTARSHKTKRLTRCGDGTSCGILSRRGCMVDRTASMQFSKAQPAMGAAFLRFSSQPTGTVSYLTCPSTQMLTLPSAVSFGFYHFACIMLLRYKPGPKFAIRNVGSLSETDVRTKVTKQHEHLLIEVESDLDACSRHFRG